MPYNVHCISTIKLSLKEKYVVLDIFVFCFVLLGKIAFQQ